MLVARPVFLSIWIILVVILCPKLLGFRTAVLLRFLLKAFVLSDTYSADDVGIFMVLVLIGSLRSALCPGHRRRHLAALLWAL